MDMDKGETSKCQNVDGEDESKNDIQECNPQITCEFELHIPLLYSYIRS